MQKKLLICSSSTEKFSDDFPDLEKLIFSGKIKFSLFNEIKHKWDLVIALGGGGCMDLGKIATRENLICYPTTASGACQTSHSVVWDDDKKLTIKTTKPNHVIIKEKYIKGLPENALKNTFCDAVSHNLDVLYSINKTIESEKYAKESLQILRKAKTIREIIIAGNIAGNAIEITPTTLLHSLSYPITGKYGIPHGEALGILLKKMKDYYNFDIEKFYKIEDHNNIDFDYVVEEAFHYEKIKNFSGKISKNDLKKILMEL